MKKKSIKSLVSHLGDNLTKEQMKKLIGGNSIGLTSETCSVCYLYGSTGTTVDTLNVAPGTPMSQCQIVAGPACYAHPQCYTYSCH
ncbi:hypothetical protein [Pleomorphovibrio marinus]|uniref:hypothetical protein n=1 Tax=Pleomorphovibrio marinus TaxID=2164132 RepID=UPI00130044C6|nr:hypothetical protein [Pleomorphovibrio marinus]